MNKGPLSSQSIQFAIDIVNYYKWLTSEKKEYVLSKQVLRSGTSIGANIHEANYAHGKADFIAKLQIALKECYETEYWLELMQKANLLPDDTVKGYLHDCGSIRRMLIASINTVKEKQK